MRPVLVRIGAFAPAKIGAFALAVWFQFTVYPGHTYLRGPSQAYVAQLEHLDEPAFLTRDSVATAANLTFTVFDEVSLFLHRSLHLNLETALADQQIASRAAGLTGITLIAAASGLTGWWPLSIAVLVGFTGPLPGIEVAPFDLAATPYTIAFGFILLGVGLFVTGKPLLSGGMAGLALLYDPRMAAPFWLLMLAALVLDRRLRKPIRAMLPLLAVFALLLANFAQLQPVSLEARNIFGSLPGSVEAVQRLRTPALWLSSWGRHDTLFYILFCWFVFRSMRPLWPEMNRELRWTAGGLSLAGLASVLMTSLLLGLFHLRVVPLLQPLRIMLFTVVIGIILCVAACRKLASRWRWAFLAGPALALAFTVQPREPAEPDRATREAAQWASEQTWGASMFVFADAETNTDAGAFRALALRPVWVDWQTGWLCDSSDSFALEWMNRWDEPSRLTYLVRLPVDYVVLPSQHAVYGVKPAFVNSRWAIYDASELRDLPRDRLR